MQRGEAAVGKAEAPAPKAEAPVSKWGDGAKDLASKWGDAKEADGAAEPKVATNRIQLVAPYSPTLNIAAKEFLPGGYQQPPVLELPTAQLKTTKGQPLDRGAVTLSKAALQAAARATKAAAPTATKPPPARPPSFFALNAGVDGADVKQQLGDLKQDLYIAMMALKAAQEKMHYLEKAIGAEVELNGMSAA